MQALVKLHLLVKIGTTFEDLIVFARLADTALLHSKIDELLGLVASEKVLANEIIVY